MAASSRIRQRPRMENSWRRGGTGAQPSPESLGGVETAGCTPVREESSCAVQGRAIELGRIVAVRGRIAIRCNHPFRCPHLMRTMSADTLQLDLPDVEDRLEFREFALRFLGYVGIWLVLVILFATVGYVTDWLGGHAWKFHAYLTWSFIQWSTLALLLPVALWLAPHDAIEPPHRWRVLWANFGVSLIFALTAVILGAVLTDFILPNAEL